MTQLLERLEGIQGKGSVIPAKSPPSPKVPAPKPAIEEKATVEAVPKAVPSHATDISVQPEESIEKVAEKVAEQVKETDEKVEAIEKPAVLQTVQKDPSRQITEESVTETAAEAPTKEVRKNWDEFIEYVMDRKKWMAHTLRLCSNVRVEDTDLILKFDDPSDCKMLQTKENLKFLTEFSQDFFQKEFKVVIKIRGADSNGVINELGNGPQEERRALANDPLVQMATEVLGGRVVKIRTGPRSR